MGFCLSVCLVLGFFLLVLHFLQKKKIFWTFSFKTHSLSRPVWSQNYEWKLNLCWCDAVSCVHGSIFEVVFLPNVVFLYCLIFEEKTSPEVGNGVSVLHEYHGTVSKIL